jgi:hypothetical protein
MTSLPDARFATNPRSVAKKRATLWIGVGETPPDSQPLPEYVHLPKEMFNCGNFVPGVLAGFGGHAYDPFIAGDAGDANYRGARAGAATF